MHAAQLQTLLEGGAFFESPRWHDGSWWVSDFYRHAVLRVGTDGSQEVVLEVEGQPSGIGWMPDGSMLVVSMRDHRVLRRDTSGEVSVHADLSAHCGGHLNDMVVDVQGRAWVGEFGFDLMGAGDPAAGNLMRVDPDGTHAVVATEMLFANGSVITPDGSTLIVGETAGNRYSAFTIGRDGALTDRRVWAQFAPPPPLGGTLAEGFALVKVAPDGCCLDAEGYIWAADAVGARCIRVAPGAEIVQEVRAPEGLGIFACMLGGADGRTLVLCCAPDFLEHNRVLAREAVLLSTQVDVPHGGLP
ncbi:MAG: SMP-30/gluconolactonase/LRE family protein [Solirubrobacterales bacterium]|jgi:sugar lactone lactonase YvrE